MPKVVFVFLSQSALARHCSILSGFLLIDAQLSSVFFSPIKIFYLKLFATPTSFTA